MTYADSESKDYEALLNDDEFLREPALTPREKHTRAWTLIHTTVLLAYSLLFAFLLYKQMNTVKCWQGTELIYCTSLDQERYQTTDLLNQPLPEKH